MRGRTNIPPRKNPVINGELQSFVVANGHTITKGDFVSFQVQNMIESTPLLENVNFTKITKRYVPGYFIQEGFLNNKSYYYLVKCENGNITIIDSINNITTGSSEYVNSFDIYDNKVYILTSDKKVRIYSVSISGFTFIEEIPITYSGYSSYMMSVCVLDSTHLVIMNYYTGQQPSYSYGFVMYLDEENSSITRLYTFLTESGTGYHTLKRINGNTIAIAPKLNTNGGNKYTIVKFSNDFSSSTKIERNLPSVLLYDFDFSDDGLCFCGYSIDENVPSSSNSRNVYVMKYVESDDNIELLNVSLTSYFTYYATGGVINFIGDEILVTQFYVTSPPTTQQTVFCVESAYIGLTSLGLEVVDNATSEMISTAYSLVNQFYDVSSSRVNVAMLLSLSNQKYFMRQMVEDDEITIGVITSFVEEYSGNSRKPIGFANTSGNAGEIVQVFVPPTNQSNL